MRKIWLNLFVLPPLLACRRVWSCLMCSTAFFRNDDPNNELVAEANSSPDSAVKSGNIDQILLICETEPSEL